MYTVVILGGYGFFGRRISRALAARRDLRVLIGGRERQRASGAARALGLGHEAAVELDTRDPQLAHRLRDQGADAVIHAAGPFQGQDYAVARAAIAAGCHYVDLADGRDFVCGIAALDGAARAAGVAVISGASSVPALSCAVVERYLGDFRRLDSIDIGISASARIPGHATLQSVLSYAGKPFCDWHEGAERRIYGWLGLRRHRFPPPLGGRWLANCDVPDLQLLPQRYAALRQVTFGAGSASAAGQVVVWGLAQLVRAGLLRDATPWCGALHHLSRAVEALGSDQGGMFVSLSGESAEGKRHCVTWSLLARRNHGAHIPCAAAIALTLRLAARTVPAPGARPCVGVLTADEMLAPLRGLELREVVS